MKQKTFLLIITSIFVFSLCRPAAAADLPSANAAAAATPTITLEVVRAFDERLPKLSDTDMAQVFDVARGIISSKLSGEINVVFHDNGEMPLGEFFKSVDYQNRDSSRYDKQMKYDRALGAAMPVFKQAGYRKTVVDFLKQWDIKSLAEFFPGKKTENYDDAFDNLMAVYHEKVKWQETLKTKDGAPLVIDPPAPYQSYVEWALLMFAQDKYDIVITNGLITYDYLPEPYPHSITKHAKVGGSSFNSPKRAPLEGKSLMVNIFEDYGEVPGISRPPGAVPPDMRNKIIGAYYFAHEFGHAFFYLPDVYDHPLSCLMNSAPGVDDLKGYEYLVSDPHPCPKCRPWIGARLKAFHATLAAQAGDFKKAGRLYLEAARETPESVDTDYYYYIKSLCGKANKSFMETGDFKGMRECQKITAAAEKQK